MNPIKTKLHSKSYKNALTLLLIVFLFFSPLWLANWIFFKEKHLIVHTTNHGTFITPPIDVSHLPLHTLAGVPLNTNPFKGRWTLLAVNPFANMNSIKKLYEMRQIRLMLGKNMNEVQRMLLFYRAKTPVILSSELIAPYKGSLLVVIDEKKWVLVFNTNSVPQNSPVFEGFFIVTPNGQLMMSYHSNTNPKDIMQDLRQLIEVNKKDTPRHV